MKIDTEKATLFLLKEKFLDLLNLAAEANIRKGFPDFEEFLKKHDLTKS